MILKRFSVFYIILIVCSSASMVRAQASMQRGVHISNANGSIISIQTGAGPQSYTLNLPQASNPSLTTGSLLYALGGGNLNWTGVTGAADGFILTLKNFGGDLIPTWVDPSVGGSWLLGGNATASAWNGTTGNFLGTTSAEPLVLATTNTTTPEPIEFYTNNTEKMRLSSAGNLGIGQTNPSQLLEVRNGNFLLSNAGTADQLQFQGTGTGITTLQAGAQGATNINYTFPITAPSVSGQVLSSTTGGAMSWTNASTGTLTSVGLALPVSVFNISGSPVTTSGTLTGSFTTQTANTVFAGPVSGGAAVPTFRGLVAADLPSLNNTAWLLLGNSGTTAYNGTTGNFLGTTDAQPLVVATTNTISSQPIEFFTNNAEKMRLTPAGELGIGVTPTAGRLLNVAGTAGTSNVRLNSLSAATAGTTGRVMFADATGDLQAFAFPGTTGQVLSSTNAGVLSWITPATGVTSVGLALPASVFNISGSPVTTSGTLTGSFTTQTANTVFAGPTSGGAAVPTFRSLVSADIPVLNYVTSIGLQMPAVLYSSVTNSPITTSGTLIPQLATQTANMVFAGPASGAAATPTFRALVVGDLPSLANLDWVLAGNSTVSAWNGTTGSFLGTTSTQPLVIATTNTTTAQPIEFFTNNTEKMRLLPSGNLGIGQTNPSQLLEVKNGNVLLSNTGSADQLQFQGTSSGVTTLQAGAQGATNITYTLPTATPVASSLLYSSGGAVSNLSWTNTGSNGQVLTISGGVPSWQNSGAGGSYVNYNTLSAQNIAVITATNYLYNVAYAASATTNNALGAVISSASGTVGVTNATGLTVTATANSTGTSTGLSVTAGGGTTNYAALFNGGRVGIGNAAPNTGLDLSADLATREFNYITSMPASNNDMNFDAAGNQIALVRIAAAAAPFTITGLAGGQNGKLMTIYNASGQSLSIANQNAGSIATNRFITGTGGTLIVPSGGSVNLGYSPTDSRWFVNSLNDISTLTGSFVNYNISSPQSTAIITSPNYLYNVAYAASATTNNALGAVITSASGTSGATNATGLAITATANGAGTSTGLNVTTGGGTTNYAATFSGGNVGIGQIAPTQLLEVRNGNLLLSNTGTGYQLQLQGTGSGLTTFQAGAQGATSLNYTWPTAAPGANSLLYSSGGSVNNLNWTNVGANGSTLTILGGVPTWQIDHSWLTTGNTGLVDNVSNLFGTLDNTLVRFVSGSGGPNTRMILDFNGNMLFGKNSANTTFTIGSGRLAFGDSLSTTRLNSVPTYTNRVFNMIDPSSVVRIWRFNSNAGGTDPAVEFIGGTNDNQGNAANQWWDIYATGTPGVAGSGTGGQGEHMSFRRRTGAHDSEYLAIFVGGNIGIGNNNINPVPAADTRLVVRQYDGASNTISNLISVTHSTTNVNGPTAGYGSGIVFKGDDSLGSATPIPSNINQEMARVAGVWTNAVDANRTGALTFSTVNNASAETEHVRIAGNGNVGIGTTNPNVSMDINGALATEAYNVTLSNGTNNNVAGLGNQSFARIIGPTAAFTITGIAGGSDGQILRIVNTTSQNMTLANQSASSTAANRIYSSTGSDVVLKGTNASAEFIYDATNNQWVMTNTNSNSFSGPIGSIAYVTKAIDQSVINSIVLVNDNDISFSTNANETWEIHGELHADNTANASNVKIAFTTPAGSTMKIYYEGVEDGGVSGGASVLTASGVAKTVNIAGGTSTYIRIHGIVRNVGTGGTVQLKWAQGTANGAATILRTDSFVKAQRVN